MMAMPARMSAAPRERARAEALVQEEEGGQPGEDWFEGEEDGGVGGGEVLLGPALDGESGGGGEEAGDGEGDKRRGVRER